MCGIAGIVGNHASSKKRELDLMLHAMIHRGPDGNGSYEAPSGSCVLGHRRLAIMDLSDAAAQPMSTTNRRYTLSYNGELYNMQALQEHLPPLPSSGDAAVLLYQLAKEQEEALPKLNGMFAFAFWDEKEESLLLARDRYGQKPLYYCEYEGKLYFSSEVRALLKAGSIQKTINPSAIEHYLRLGSIQGPQTIFENISLLPPSSFLKWTAQSGIQIQRYWTPPTSKQEQTPDEIRSGFLGAISRHLISDAPLGIFLSGGIDSSAILGAASELRSQNRDPIHAVTISFPHQLASDEADYAKAMVRKTSNTKHEIIPVSGPECAEAIVAFMEAQDQPSIDGLNTWIISKAAKKLGLKAMLSGLGSDELFGGYENFYTVPKWIARRKYINKIRGSLEYSLRVTPEFSKSIGKLRDLLNASNNSLDIYRISRQLFSESQRKSLLASELGKSSTHSSDLEYLIQLGTSRNLADQIGLWELFGYMSQTLLRDADTMGMAHGVEIRMPFLDTVFSDSILTLPSNAREPHSVLKHKLVQSISEYLPPEHLQQKKRGFSIPLASLLQNELREYSENALKHLKNRDDICNPHKVEKLWKTFIQSPKQVGVYRPWILISLGNYLKDFE